MGDDLRHILNEAVSNAVRHGAATHVRIRVARSEGRISIDIEDNGSGIPSLSGAYNGKNLAQKRAGPLSLRTRVNDLAGSLFLTSSPCGTRIEIEVPA